MPAEFTDQRFRAMPGTATFLGLCPIGFISILEKVLPHHMLNPIKLLYHCSFEIGLCSVKEGGHGRLGRVETGLLARPLQIWNQRSRSQHTGGTHCARVLKSKSKRLLVLAVT